MKQSLVSLLLLGVMFYSNVSSQERYSRKERKGLIIAAIITMRFRFRGWDRMAQR